MDLSQIVPYVLAQAQWIGPALLVLGLLIRLVGRVVGRALLLVGLLGTAAFAYQEWQVAHNVLWAGAILVLGLVVFGLLAWTVRGISFLFAFVILAAGFYLVLYGWAGPAFAGSLSGSLTWAAAAVATMAATGFRKLALHGVTAVARAGV